MASSLLMLVVAMLSATLPHCYGGKTVIVSTSGKDTATACLSGVGKCSNLTMALDGVTNDTTVTIERGTYTLRYSAHHKFNQVKNVVISGQAPASEVMVNCSDGAGLAFHHATTVHISKVSFYHCGYEQLSNSRVRKDNNFAKYNVSLFFQLCKDVTLNQVNVSYSKGIAVQFFATIGNNMINWCNFMNNTMEQTVGGGLYIEFPYCLPGNDYCEDTSNVPEEFRTGGTFVISNSNFYYNEAKDKSRVFMVPHLADHISFGRGGGLSVFFKGNSSLSSIFVIHCHFIGNQAVFGGGAFVDFQDSCHNNKVFINWCSFDSNQATQQGGGLRINFASSISSKGPQVSDMHHNNITIVINAFINNEAHTSGGGMFFGATRENTSFPTNKLTIAFGNWIGNIAPVGSAISMIGWHEVTQGGAIIAPVLGECLFDSNRPPNIDHSIRDEQSVGKGTVYLDSIPIQFAGYANFTNNKHTALAGANTGIYFKNSTKYKFINNSARQGGAIALLGNAYFILNHGTKLEFINNTAYYLGGAIYATSLTGQDSISSGNCFIRYYDLMKDPYKWDVNFRFINNTAMGKRNAIYTSSPQPCLWGRAFGPPRDDLSNMSAVFCWNNASSIKKKWDYGGSECGDEIMSAPSKFDHNRTSVEIKLNDVIPGKWKSFDLKTFDDFGHDVSNYTVFAAQSLSHNVILSDHSHYLAHNSILLNQKNRDAKTGRVALQTVNTPNPIMATLNVTFMECPPGFKLIQDQCTCVAKNYNNKLVCDTNAIPVHSDIVRGYWIGRLPNDNMTVVMAFCRFCSYKNNTVSVESFDDVQRKLCHTVNRAGPLCSKCKNSSYCLAVNSESYDCINYNENISFPFRILYFILYKFLFPLIFLWFVYRFGIKIASGKYNAPVFFAQMVTTVVPMDLDGALWYPSALKKFYYMLYDMFNLELRLPDYSRFCLHPHMSITFVIALNYCVALLPLVLVIAMAIVYRCYDKGYKAWCCYFDDDQNQDSDSRTGCKKVFYYINRVLFSSNRDFIVSGVAAFFVLSYMKIAVTTCMLISPTKLINGDGYVLYMDGTKRYPDDIIPYLALALIFCVYLFMVPFSLLILRYGKQGYEGFLHYLLKGLQANFRSLPSGDQNTESRRYLTCWKNKKICDHKHRCEAKFNTDTELCSAEFECCPGTCSICFCSCSVYDFRWVSGAYFVLRILMVLSYLVLPTNMIQLLCQMVICCAAAAFFIVFQPYGYNHTEKEKQQQEPLQELDDTAQGSASVNLARSPSKKYNRLDAAVFLALAMVIAICIYRSYLTDIDSTASIPALTLQSVLLFLPAVWFGFHMLFDLKKRLSDLGKWCTDVKQKRRRGGILYDPVPVDDKIEENDDQNVD